jgi:tryptophan halogenase
MKVCIVGTGASGWMAANYLLKNPNITEIVIIGSSKIPTIGVGESTTGRFDDFLEMLGVDAAEFVTESDAAVKYGVQYEGWGPRTFLHTFKSRFSFDRRGVDQEQYGRILGRKPQGQCIHELISDKVWEFTRHNHVSTQAYGLADQGQIPREVFGTMPREYVNAWHFDANCFIRYMSRRAQQDQHVDVIDDRVIDCERNEQGDITAVICERTGRITADYFVISTGETEFNQRAFGAEYSSLGDVLLTDRAVFMPIEYRDLDQEFHPYTVARSMRHGWRWITPTFSRIGSGYAFSSRHCSDEEAVAEFLADAGEPDRKPFVVDFKPRTIKQQFHRRHCFLGMASGFLEPLDAPGLDMTVNSILQIDEYLGWNDDQRALGLDRANANAKRQIEWLTSFILAQYKHSTRSDTAFWRDQKATTYAPYENIMANLDNIGRAVGRKHHMMFYHTIAARDVQWSISPELANVPLITVPEIELPTMHHRYFIEDLREQYQQNNQ